MPVRPKEVLGLEEGDGLTMEMEEDIGVKGISSGAVKCVEIGKNTDGEGTLLGYY